MNEHRGTTKKKKASTVGIDMNSGAGGHLNRPRSQPWWSCHTPVGTTELGNWAKSHAEISKFTEDLGIQSCSPSHLSPGVVKAETANFGEHKTDGYKILHPWPSGQSISLELLSSISGKLA
jgi:hypothetical protein